MNFCWFHVSFFVFFLANFLSLFSWFSLVQFYFPVLSLSIYLPTTEKNRSSYHKMKIHQWRLKAKMIGLQRYIRGLEWCVKVREMVQRAGLKPRGMIVLPGELIWRPLSSMMEARFLFHCSVQKRGAFFVKKWVG